MDQPGAPDEPRAAGPTAEATPPPDGESAPPTRVVPLRDSALGALGIAAPVLSRFQILWLPTVLTLLYAVPQVLILPDAFFTSRAIGGTMTPDEASAFFVEFQRQMWSFLAVTVIETLLFLPFVTAITYRLAFDFLDGRPTNPLGGDPVGTGLRVLVSSLIVMAVFAAFFLAGGLIFTLLVASGAAVFLLLLMPILIVFAVIVFLRLLPVATLVVQGQGAVESVQRAWSLTEGQVVRIFRWGLVVWLVALVGGLATELLTQVGALVAPVRVAYLLSAVVQGPLQVVTAIVLTLLVRLLQHGPSEDAPVRSIGPDWGAPPPPSV
jgi:hypothetical protein